MKFLLVKSYKIIAEFFKKNINLKCGLKILDVGCGCRGNFINFDSGTYYGIDINAEALAKVQKKNGDKYAIMDAKHLAFADGAFDYIISTSFLHHLDDRQCQALCEQINKKLKDSGRAIIADGVFPEEKFNLIGKIMRKLDHGRFVRHRQKLRTILSKNFSIINEYYFVNLIFAYAVFVLKKR
ncbi:MAG: class I SAM-dependent methyltransferase [Candidatus Omnitrophica bacterium]|nr:class I SAM-dependent methyltransferase [Candidatus Omnitrophota bacterium]MBU1924589.1 class I SAM-dependent methyltransferase [Candidatus Omnitrophota bacterium]